MNRLGPTINIYLQQYDTVPQLQTVIDEYSRACLVTRAARRIRSVDVIEALLPAEPCPRACRTNITGGTNIGDRSKQPRNRRRFELLPERWEPEGDQSRGL